MLIVLSLAYSKNTISLHIEKQILEFDFAALLLF